jgi:hypothetical protein
MEEMTGSDPEKYSRAVIRKQAFYFVMDTGNMVVALPAEGA